MKVINVILLILWLLMVGIAIYTFIADGPLYGFICLIFVGCAGALYGEIENGPFL